MTKDEIKCHDCNGAGRQVGVFVEYAEGVEGPVVATVKCDRCNGRGVVSMETEQWVKRGRDLRQRRIDSRLTLRAASKELGMGAADLSRLECGKEDNTQFDPDYKLFRIRSN